MWQLMDEDLPDSAACHLFAEWPRFDATRSTDAAGCYLSRLLVEFGEDPSCSRWPATTAARPACGARSTRLPSEPGGFRKRDFWHLYRLKLLPPETREYVPKVIAAAIVLGHPEKYARQE